jgi:hypothetical protein
MPIQTYAAGTIATLIDTALNSMANNALVAGSAFSASDYLLAKFELYIASFSAAPTANTGFALWLLATLDGTNYADGSTSVTPADAPNCVFSLRAVSTVQRRYRRITIEPGTWIPLLKNDGTGVSAAATGNTLRIVPVSYQQ